MTTTSPLGPATGVQCILITSVPVAPSSTAAPSATAPPAASTTLDTSPTSSPSTAANSLLNSTTTPLVASTTTPSCGSDNPAVSGGLGDFTYANLVTIAAALIAAASVVITLLVNAARGRRDHLATLYANALGAVAEYLEGPYRILRKDGESGTRFAITSKLSDVKTSIDQNQALLRLHAREGVADAYDDFVVAAKREAGKQMHMAWKAAPVTTDDGVNLYVALPRGNTEAARARLVEVMQADLLQRWWSRKSRRRYSTAIQAVADARRPTPESAPGKPGTSA